MVNLLNKAHRRHEIIVITIVPDWAVISTL